VRPWLQRQTSLPLPWLSSFLHPKKCFQSHRERLPMAKLRESSRHSKLAQSDELFVLAARQEDKGNVRRAAQIYLAGARAGDSGCQLNLGNLYEAGSGVRCDRAAALYWHKRAYKQGRASAAHNIGVMWRNEKKFAQALGWFKKTLATEAKGLLKQLSQLLARSARSGWGRRGPAPWLSAGEEARGLAQVVAHQREA